MLALVIILGVIILLDLSPIGGNYRMYAAWIQCGQKPVAAYTFMNEKSFEYHPLYTPVEIFQPDKYYCSAQEAQAAGYESSILFRENDIK